MSISLFRCSNSNTRKKVERIASSTTKDSSDFDISLQKYNATIWFDEYSFGCVCGEYGPCSKKFTEFIIVKIIFNRNEVHHLLSLTIAKNSRKRKKTKTTGSDLNLQLSFRIQGILKPYWKTDWLKRLRPKIKPQKNVFLQ